LIKKILTDKVPIKMRVCFELTKKKHEKIKGGLHD